jgi:hypothetical protein
MTISAIQLVVETFDGQLQAVEGPVPMAHVPHEGETICFGNRHCCATVKHVQYLFPEGRRGVEVFVILDRVPELQLS